MPHILAKSACATLLAAVSFTALAQTPTDRYGALVDSEMIENRSTPATAKLLKDELLFQRATQAYLWALPPINTLGMKFGSEKIFGVGYDELPVLHDRTIIRRAT